MLQYAVPSAPTSFAKPPSAFAESSSRTQQPPANIEKSYGLITNARRSPSATPTSHITSQTTSKAEKRVDQSHSPALSALASLAANAPVAISLSKEDSGEVSSVSSTPSGNNMNPTQYAPAATAGGTQNGPPVCQNCGTSTTPLWRRDESGSVLCNACGLFLKLHSRPRPISLKTDVIKSRNRVKTSQAKKRDSHGGNDALVHAPNGYAAAHPQSANHEAQTHHTLPSGVVPGEHPPPPLPSPGSLSRSNTPGLGSHNGGIAPQHIFDSVGITSDTFASPNMPSFALRQPSPSGSSLNGNSVGNLDTAQGYDAMLAQNNQLRTRVSELEVINDLFRGRVGELESGEQNARRDAQTKDEEVQRLMADLGSANARVAELEKRLAEIQAVENDHDEGPARKRSRTDDV